MCILRPSVTCVREEEPELDRIRSMSQMEGAKVVLQYSRPGWLALALEEDVGSSLSSGLECLDVLDS